jgi:hypothetical protein
MSNHCHCPYGLGGDHNAKCPPPVWIPAEEFLPEPFEDVLTAETLPFADERIVFLGYWDGKTWHATGFENEEAVVSHWMPLPEPPKC